MPNLSSSQYDEQYHSSLVGTLFVNQNQVPERTYNHYPEDFQYELSPLDRLRTSQNFMPNGVQMSSRVSTANSKFFVYN